ncbi:MULTISPECIES: SUKH-4 family immunity protein [unclassified Kitasatospora]|uniref:SUKH-4 family immunity protein n=1 Tax=unclassified Kitasatospora TaxID=2633591 RepID=UPI002E328146|nr:SUKH-4 family immunity protein [Kitasatospora sp. NBC_01246]
MLVGIDWPRVVAEAAPGDLLRFKPDEAARIWPDGDGARFVTEIGVPFSNGLFRLLEELADRRPENPDWAFARPLTDSLVETEHGTLRQLGELSSAFVFVNLDDGTIWVCDPDADEEYQLIHRDISSLAYLVYKIAIERPRPEERPTPYDWADAEEYIREGMGRWDDLPFGSEAEFWNSFLDFYQTT